MMDQGLDPKEDLFFLYDRVENYHGYFLCSLSTMAFVFSYMYDVLHLVELGSFQILNAAIECIHNNRLFSLS